MSQNSPTPIVTDENGNKVSTGTNKADGTVKFSDIGFSEAQTTYAALLADLPIEDEKPVVDEQPTATEQPVATATPAPMTHIPQTADTFPLALLIAILAISGGAVALLIVGKKRKK